MHSVEYIRPSRIRSKKYFLELRIEEVRRVKGLKVRDQDGDDIFLKLKWWPGDHLL